MTPDRFVVVVPARNEAALIGPCVDSILRSAAAAEIRNDQLVVTVVADTCGDDTASVARHRLRSAGIVVETAARSVGRARAVGTACGLARWASSPPERIWTAHTDADTLVPESWLHHHRRVADAGFAAVAGVVEVDSFDDHGPHTAQRHRAQYAGPSDHHPHVHGANLGVRADAYRVAGGWSAIPSGEDHALWNAVRRAGYPTLCTRSVSVVTSGRRVGRAPDGFAGQLRALGTPC